MWGLNIKRLQKLDVCRVMLNNEERTLFVRFPDGNRHIYRVLIVSKFVTRLSYVISRNWPVQAAFHHPHKSYNLHLSSVTFRFVQVSE